ncbi:MULTISPECIES: chemotaxis protein CheW [unclassified Bosea (in: a-proteobacteria)]|uniref:chemotaxis protein CheW n=1 Tax=unclassified Bosea (in: a-proteobacteria) TaxID=2653178 RepID=UPI000F74ED01|nr:MULTISPECIES: chemotaxis protein CheW [unclassified Bosea (in: a-proteobacteria)]AZO76184.1 chemotaxis protein CheW [Bosea sp. Tri-49]RXT26106.1 chemotaxis protein CheW [Bosea sp. Tri-39]RXT31348.1 chemotaxis protein CheW [Bosea sp. Tri-54]
MTGTSNDSEAGVAAFEDSLDYVTVTVGGQLLGLPIARVQDVFIATRVTPVPLAPSEIVGLINLRGRVVTAICMRRRMGRVDAAAAPAGVDGRELTAVGIDQGGEAFALIVDTVGEVMRLSRTTFEPVPIHLDRAWAALAKGVHRLDDRLLVVIDVDAVLNIELPVAA